MKIYDKIYKVFFALFVVCVDKHDDCKQYGKASCHGAYYSWAKDNCRQYCGFCVGEYFFILKSLLNQTDAHSLTVKFTK